MIQAADETDENGAPAGSATGQPATQRLDKWLWFVRAVKSRSLAQKLIEDGKVRVNRERTDRPSLPVKPGDVVTFMLRDGVRVLQVVQTGLRRGPASAAQSLYQDLSPPRRADETHDGTSVAAVAARDPGAGRPTKRDRRQLERFRDDWPDES